MIFGYMIEGYKYQYYSLPSACNMSVRVFCDCPKYIMNVDTINTVSISLCKRPLFIFTLPLVWTFQHYFNSLIQSSVIQIVYECECILHMYTMYNDGQQLSAWIKTKRHSNIRIHMFLKSIVNVLFLHFGWVYGNCLRRQYHYCLIYCTI